ncbi:hypothetical protein FACS1894111_05500 [Clostridia bacterium]|nr:hypothetical protein FACS1894111_05500 [Clostridia bacterium]
MGYTNSSLVNYTKLSPNHSGQRNHAIDTITPHCIVGQLSVETIGQIFSPTSFQASANYAIGADGRVALIVEEKNRSWCTSSSANDNRAVTIELASGLTDPYEINEAVYNKFIDLCVDICRRNGIPKLRWTENKGDIGNTAVQNITVHRWFKNKACPGEWLYSRLGAVAEEVNSRLAGNPPKSGANEPSVPSIPVSSTTGGYTVKITTDSLNIRAGAGTQHAVVGRITDKGLYTIIETYEGWGKLKSGIGWISLEYTEKESSTQQITPQITPPTIANATDPMTTFVRGIQIAIGASPDGIAGAETLNKTVTVSKTINRKHAVVAVLQGRLNALGFNAGIVDGIAGNQFDTATKSFQKSFGGVEDGEFTAQKTSWKKILGM